MRIAVINLNQIWEDKEANKVKILDIMKSQIKGCNVDLCIFPEMTLTGFSVKNPKIAEPKTNSPTCTFFSELSKAENIGLVFGMSTLEDGRIYNESVFLDAGVELGRYRKNYLFTYSGEGDFYEAGENIKGLSFRGVNFGMTICFDLRFPEHYRKYTNNDVVINIANWPEVRNEHWRNLLCSRAIENQFFTIGVNRIGMDGNELSYAYVPSVFSPLGEGVTPDVISEEVRLYNIDVKQVQSVREKFPFLKEIKA